MKARIFNENSKKTSFIISSGVIVLLCILVGIGFYIPLDSIPIQLTEKNQAPALTHLFGTDWLGRDMLLRTVKGLSLSFGVGIIAAFSSTMIALLVSIAALWHEKADRFVTWLIDLFLSVPHLVTLILISFAAGGGFKGVVIGLALTHWPAITRLLRAELLQLQTADYVAVSKRLGKSKGWIVLYHFLPHLLPQLLIGFILMFPHAILHEASITFLGFGLSAESPAIGIILSESMKYLSVGVWWLAFFPGLSLLLLIGLFDLFGRHMRQMIDPFHGQKG